MKISKKIWLIIVTLIAVVCLSGCDENIDTYIDGFTTNMNQRISANQQEVDKLQAAGLISTEAASSLKEAIAAQSKTIAAMNKNDISKYIYATKSAPVSANLKNKEQALTIVSRDDASVQQLLSNLNLNIYVLKRNHIDGSVDENNLITFDVIAQEIEKAKSGQASNIDSYFVDSGKTLWDMNDTQNQLIKHTEGDKDLVNSQETINTMGTDFVGIKTETDMHGNIKILYAIQVPLMEFNRDAVTRLCGKDGANKDMYVIAGNKLYLMQYPVWYVKGFTATNQEYTANYEESDLMINILTKKIMHKDGRECVTSSEPILKIDGGGSIGDLGNASFVLDGVTGKQTTYGHVKAPVDETQFGRVVLRDYLELNYMTKVVEGENLVALGRRVRLTKFKGTGDEDIGLFVDKAGSPIQNSLNIKSTHLMDITAGIDNKKKKLNLDANAATPSPTPSPSASPTNTTSVYTLGQSQDKLLETELVDSITCGTKFPGGASGVVDKGDNDALCAIQNTNSSNNASNSVKCIMYGIAVDIDPFQSNLFSGWIDVTGENEPVGSLDWWNNWLAMSTFNYNIDRDAVLAFLTGNYTYEMSDNGLILLDIPTIVEIQKEYDDDYKRSTITWINTIFVVLGISLMAYAIILMTAWIYDTNIIAGPRLLKVLSFRRWEAVSNDDEMPYVDPKNRHYMTFNKMVKSCIIIIAIGSLLIFVNITDIVDSLILVFGHFAEVASNIIQGIK